MKLPLICAVFLAVTAVGPVRALSLEDAILFVLETNPEITAAEANKQAIEFELEQAQSFYLPRFEIEAWVGSSVNNGTTLSDVTAAPNAIEGYSLTGRITQLLFDGRATKSEVERQAYRIDAAAYRVLERSEVLSLEAVRVYADVLRARSLVGLARQNLDYHQRTFQRLEAAHRDGVVPIGDLQQARERVLQAEDLLLNFQIETADIETLFLAVVGVEPKNLGAMPPLNAAVPASLDQSLAVARQRNPAILFAQSDVGASEALSRTADANRFPRFNFEIDGTVGEDLNGFEGRTEDLRAGFVMRYDFQGNRKKAERQEQVRRVGQQRAQLLSQARLVEQEVRETWTSLQTAQRRIATVSSRANLARQLRQTYEEEYRIGVRSLLDVLNTQNALLQAEAELVNARSLELFVRYRLLAATGTMLASMGIAPPEDAAPYAREQVNAPDLQQGNTNTRFDASEFSEWRKSRDR